MNLPNTLQSQHYQQNRNDSADFGFSSAQFIDSDKTNVESLFQSDKSEKFPSTATGSNHKMRPINHCYFGYDKCFDTNAIEYHPNNSNYSYENRFETNPMANQQCTQSFAYNTNYAEINQPSNETGEFYSIFIYVISTLFKEH